MQILAQKRINTFSLDVEEIKTYHEVVNGVHKGKIECPQCQKKIAAQLNKSNNWNLQRIDGHLRNVHKMVPRKPIEAAVEGEEASVDVQEDQHHNEQQHQQSIQIVNVATPESLPRVVVQSP